MRNKTIQLLFAIVVGCSFLGVLAQVDDAVLSAAKKDHDKQCARCHGKEGQGNGPTSRMLKVKPADWTDDSRMGELSDEQLLLIIEKGGEAVGKSKLMPAFQAKLSEEQIKRLIVFVKSFRSKE